MLGDLIRQSRKDAADYEKFLKDAEALVRGMAERAPEQGVPAVLHGHREATVIFNNLPEILALAPEPMEELFGPTGDYDKAHRLASLALNIDRAIRENAPAGWKGDQAREAQVLNALFPLLGRNREVTLALFELIKNQPGYL